VENEAQTKILQLLDVISVEVAANRNDTAELRTEMHAGFSRVERRLGNLEIRVENIETRVENIETRVENIETRVENIETGLRDFRGEFEVRIAPLEADDPRPRS
jgi:predicted  nucleic acid-binding Zn-ribbon protein